MKKSVLLSALALGVTTFADGGSTPPRIKENKVMNSTSGAPVVRYLPADEINTSGNLGFFLDLQFMNVSLPEQSSWGVISQSDLVTKPHPIMTTTGLFDKQKWGWGGSIGVLGNTAYDGWQVEARYTGLYRDGDLQSVDPKDLNGSIFNTWISDNGKDIKTLAIRQYKLNMNRFNLDFIRPTIFGEQLTVTPFGGLEFGWNKNTAEETIAGMIDIGVPINPNKVKGKSAGFTKTDTQFCGPSTGLRLDWKLSSYGPTDPGYFSLFLKSKFALLVARFDKSDTLSQIEDGVTPNPDKTTFELDSKSVDITGIPVVGVDLGVNFIGSWNKNKNNCQVSLRWGGECLFGAYRTVNNVVKYGQNLVPAAGTPVVWVPETTCCINPMSTISSILVHGVSFRIGFGF
jgi:hypothetical protein